MTPEERSERARTAAHAMHARHEAGETTKAANAAMWAKYEKLADPGGQLDPAERRRRASHLMRAAMARVRQAGLRRDRERREAAQASADDALARAVLEAEGAPASRHDAPRAKEGHL